MADTLSSLRSLMASHSPPLHALIVPSEDYHQSEYVSARDKRRKFVSGFTGSAGLALVTMNEALLWTDGRYFLQAEQELSDQWKLMRYGEDPIVDIWMADLLVLALSLAHNCYARCAATRPASQPFMSVGVSLWKNLPREAAVGVDPWCVSLEAAQKWECAFTKKQQKLIQTSKNLVDEVWKNRPPLELNPVVIQPLEFAGRSVAEKLKDLREKLKQEKACGIIITTLDEVAWLYNVRGSDVPYCPVVHAYAVVTLVSAFFYVDKRKLSPEASVSSYMEENGIEVREYDAVSSDVALLATEQLPPFSKHMEIDSSETGITGNGTNVAQEESHNRIWLDPRCCFALYSKLNSDQVLLQPSPLALAKAIKNSAEMDGLKKAHIRDGAAVVQYLVWLDKQMQENYGASGYFAEAESTSKKRPSETRKLTEVSASDKLEGFRASKEHFRGLSFPTISSVGPNAAIIHYGPDAKTCSEMDPNSIYLFDSGAQYLDGTTDITRTVHFGKPSEHEKACYTAVLKGHIALGVARFPNGTNGHALDILARVPLWKDGLDYRHGPHLISFRPQARNVPLQASMTVTDEPGYYEDGNFGIRLENVLIVKEADTKFNFGDKGYLAFEHITWAPYQSKLIDVSRLVPEEIEWVNTYHAKCRETLVPFLDESEMTWLKKATEPIGA
ncbi:hypothetical protein RJ639_033885 [Escallonia herrerae]|uniref:Xaa-Pro aminopeptidase n=1 Tax=Escallonia herrerae TaxID=1293975 RepID=A0AA89BKP0_9ASTE|nr:hypothetical protein RJ639_033885 [Escallonia herrerae]